MLYPNKTMGRNLGFDGSGVNCAVSSIEESRIDMNFHVSSMPQDIKVSVAQPAVWNHMPVPSLSIASMTNRLLCHLKQIFSFR